MKIIFVLNGRKPNQHFKLLFLTINLHFVTSNQIRTNKNMNLYYEKYVCYWYDLLQ